MTAGAVWLAAFVLAPGIAGAPLIVRSGFRSLPLAARLVLSASLGGVLLSFWMTLFALLGWRWNVPILLLAAAASAAWLPVAAGDPEPDPLGPADERSGLLAGSLIASALLVSLAAAASASATSSDLVLFWGPKAQAFAAARTIDPAFLGDPFHTYMHASYPPLVTNLFALSTIVAGRFPWGAAMLTFPVLLSALALALPALLRKSAGQKAAAASSCAVICALAILGITFEIAGNADMPLFLFEALGMAVLLGPAVLEPNGQVLAGVLLAGAATAKPDGLPFAVFAGLVVLFVRRRELAFRGAVTRLLLPATICLALWFAFGLRHRLFVGYSDLGDRRFYPEHAGEVIRAVGQTLGSPEGILPFLVPLAAIVAAARFSRLQLIPCATGAALIVFFLSNYLRVPYDPTEYIRWSAGRLFTPVAAFLALAAAVSAGNAEAPETGREPRR